MSVNVVQTATGTNGGSGTAVVTFSGIPTPGNKFLFMISYSGSDTVSVPTGLTLQSTNHNSINISSAAAQIYYRDALQGDGPSWTFVDPSNWVSVIAYEISGAASGDAFDGTLTWAYGSQTPAIDGQPTYTPGLNAKGGLAISFIAEDTDYTTTSQGGSWTNLQGVTNTYHSAFASWVSPTPGTAMPAAWSVTGSNTYWIGVVFVIRQSAVYIVQSASAYNGGSGTAQLTFGAAPTAGNKLLFFVSYPGYGLPDAPSGLVLKSTGNNSINASSASAQIYYRDVVTGDSSSWGFTFIGDSVNLVGYELSGTASGDNFDATPVWLSDQHAPSTDGQPSSTPSANTSGGLTFSFLTEDTAYATVAQGGSWTSTINQHGGSYHPLQVSTQTSTPGILMVASWETTAADTYWTGAVFTVKQNFGIRSPSAFAGSPQAVSALSPVTLHGSDTTASGHTSTVAWLAVTAGAPLITTGVNSFNPMIDNSGAPQVSTDYIYQIVVTQDDMQIANSSVTLTVLPASRFIARNGQWTGSYPGKRAHGNNWV